MRRIATHVLAAMVGCGIAYAALSALAAPRRTRIVRCGRCRHATVELHGDKPQRVCWQAPALGGRVVDPSHFCGYGEAGR